MPVSPADLAGLAADDQTTFIAAAVMVANDDQPPLGTAARLVMIIERLLPQLADLHDRAGQLRDLHRPYRIYGQCTHAGGDTDQHQTVALDDGEWTCEASYQYSVCEHCCTDSAGRTEHCAEDHQHGDGLAICTTAAILDGKMPTPQPADATPVTSEGEGPLIDPDCRDGKCGSCIGGPCEHACHIGAQFPIVPAGQIAAEVAEDVRRLGLNSPATRR